MQKKNWFEVDVEGLKELQETKPKHYVLRELVQNSWDEKVTKCVVSTEWKIGTAYIRVEDDSPEGFKDIKDAFTLFKHTAKRANPEQRGRFNMGEKQAIALCDKAIVKTTKGTVEFTHKGRTEKPDKTGTGSVVMLWLKMSKSDYEEMLKRAHTYISPEGIEFTINGKKPIQMQVTEFESTLPTEFEIGGQIRNTNRKTVVRVYQYQGTDGWLYEMGLPVCKTECGFGVSVEQKIPLSLDRETVKFSYLQDIYAEVLNHIYAEITPELASEAWIRIATKDERVSKEAMEHIINQRYGDKALVANHFDPNSIDDAISSGYKVIEGSEMSGDEWGNIKRFGILQSTSDLFKHEGATDIEEVKPTEDMQEFASLTIRLASEFFKEDIDVNFVKSQQMVTASYNSDANIVTYNTAKMDIAKPFKSGEIATLFHEIGHIKGNHTEDDYHEALALMCALLYLKEVKV